MKIPKRQQAYTKHLLFHGEVRVEGCKFCNVKPDHRTNESRKSPKRFNCRICHRVFPWSYLHKSTRNSNECISCYLKTKPNLQIGKERKVLFSK